MDIIKIDESKCTRCNACVRSCPVKALQLENLGDVPKLKKERCIGCGVCLRSCSYGAIYVEDGIKATKSLFASDNKVAALIDPSIAAEFTDISDYRKFVTMFREVGFHYVIDGGFGVDIIAQEYKKTFSNFKGKHQITSKCPAIVSYIEKYYPSLVTNLTPIDTPMLAGAQIIRKKYGEHTKVVFIGPCIAAKHDAKESTGNKKVDVVLTFREIREIFSEKGLNEALVEYSNFDTPESYKGRLFPINTGLLEAGEIENSTLEGNIVTAVGIKNAQSAIAVFHKEGDKLQRHFDLFFCEGCAMGPGMSPGDRGSKFLRHSITCEYAKKRLKQFDKSCWEQHIDENKSLDFSRTFKEDNQRIPTPSPEKVTEVLKAIQLEDEYSNRGCSACGFDTCKEFAIGVAKKLIQPEMCLNYTHRTQTEYIKTLKETNEKLTRTERALKESEKVAKREQIEADDAKETFSVMLQKLPVGVVIVNDKLEVIHSNSAFIDLLGEDAKMIDEVIPGLKGADIKTLVPFNFYNHFSFVLKNNEMALNKDTKVEDKLFSLSVFPIKQHKVVGAVVQDLRSPEVRREQVIRRVTEVIDENLGMVQKIGFLLGEGAATTEKMLNSIIETYKTE